METSAQINDLIVALAKARTEFPCIVRNQTATARGGRTYQYADLCTIADATSGVLASHGLVLVQAIEDGTTEQLCISTTVYHASGQWLRCALSVPKPASMQEIGSLSTYIRRYQQSSVLNIVTEDDDDAASTQGSTTDPTTYGTAASVPNGHGQMPPTLPPITAKVSVEQLDGLFRLATETCHEDAEVFATRVRRIMHLPPNASVAKRLLARMMTAEQYAQAWTYYQTLLAQLTRPTEVPDGTASPDTPASIPAQLPTEKEAPPAAPFAVASSSAPEAATGAAGPGPDPQAEGYAMKEAIAVLKRLAAQVGPEAAEDLQDVIEHSPRGLLVDVYQRIERRLQGRLNGKQPMAAA